MSKHLQYWFKHTFCGIMNTEFACILSSVSLAVSLVRLTWYLNSSYTGLSYQSTESSMAQV